MVAEGSELLKFGSARKAITSMQVAIAIVWI
jgi:hypothetical protein